MSPVSKRRSRPDQPDAITSIMDELECLLDNEHHYTPNLDVPDEDQDLDVNSAIGRNRYINVLRCLKMWYELPSEVFIVAVNIVDRFLSKMKVQNKHIPCVAVSSFYIACNLLNETINPDDLVNISQSQCTSRDLVRMSNIISNKLHLYDGGKPITALVFLRYYHKLISIAAKKLGLSENFSRNFIEQEMFMQLEIIACDIHCSSDLPSVVALALIFIHLERFIADQKIEEIYAVKILNLFAFANELKKFCNINDCEFTQCYNKILSILNMYNGELKIPYRQRLIWKVSTRTMRKLRPTKQLIYKLPTIVEDSTYTNN